MVATGNCSAASAPADHRDQECRPARSPAPQREDQPEAGQGQREARERLVSPRCARYSFHFAGRIRPAASPAAAEQVLHLAGEDRHRDAGGETGDHRLRHVAHQGAQAQHAGGNQHQSGEQGAQDQAAVAELLDHVEHHRDEGRGGAADLHPRAAQCRDQETRDDGGVQALLRRGAGGNRQRHRERQRDDGNGKAGDQVRAEVCNAVALAQDGEQFRHVTVPGRRQRVVHTGINAIR
jgi:hypothetical protein